MKNYSLQELKDAGLDMADKSLDFEDHIDSSDCAKFWNEFVAARNKYRMIRDKLRGKT